VNEATAHLGQSIVTPIEGPVTFWQAEDYHQDYYLSQESRLTRHPASSYVPARKDAPHCVCSHR
ncbi:MAG: peptide-methionine (S)-S-oxide reductase, partial [Pseudomonadota bacterium]